jgi:uncharacterized heparinase superfamily protein
MAIADQPKVFGLALAESLRRIRRGLLGGRHGIIRFTGPVPERLVLAPRDLHTADPTVAQDIYAGIFNFAGRRIESTGANPFQIRPPNEAWLRELNSFCWLRHLDVSGDAVSATNAQALVKDWIVQHRNLASDPAWEVETAARRLIAWLSHSILIVQNADLADYRRFLRSIGQHVRFLRKTAAQTTDGMPRLLARIALAYASCCVSGKKITQQTDWRHLDYELRRQILPDGGHISRNPGVLPDILALLLPLREALARLGHAPSHEFISAIDRAASGLRFFRMGDGSIARFNHVSVTAHDLVATVLRYDNSLGKCPGDAAYSRFQRLTAGNTLVLMDTGKPPKNEMSAQAHAGCLSFEMSCGEAPVIVNCGIPPIFNRKAILAGRSSAAHSTLVLNDSSSCQFNVESIFSRYLENRIINGPGKVPYERSEDNGTVSVKASHDGYLRRFGAIHERVLALSADGNSLMGIDRVSRPDGKSLIKAGKDAVAIRFHLHPSVSAARDVNGRSVHLACSRGENWLFECIDAEPVLEESVFFAVASGSRRTAQIVLYAQASKTPEIRWIFSRRNTDNGE